MTDNTSVCADPEGPAPSTTSPIWVRVASPAAGRSLTLAQLLTVGVLFTLLLAVIVLAARPGSTVLAAGGGLSANGLVHVLILAAILLDAIVGLLLLSVLRPARRRKRDDDEPERTYQPPPIPWIEKILLGILPFLLLAALAVAIYLLHGFHLTPAGPGSHLPPATPHVTGGRTTTLPSSGSGTPAFSGIELGVALALTAVVLGLAFWWLREERGQAADEGSRLSRDLSGALDESLEDVLRESDPRRAVIVAYARMERVLASHGFPRRDYEAPLEYLARVLSQFNVSGEALRHLTDLFELARFSHHEVGAPMKERAVAALVIVRDELREAA